MAPTLAFLHKKRGAIKAKLTRFSRILNSDDPTQPTLAELQATLEEVIALEKPLEEILESIDDLMQGLPNANQEEEDEQASELRERIADMRLQLRMKINSMKSREVSPELLSQEIPSQQPWEEFARSLAQQLGDSTRNTPVNSQGGRVKLPPLSLPTFTGEYTEWTTFYDTFRSTVHENSSISPVQKLQYLKRSLKGEAEGVLKNMAITEANYEIALDMLKKDYDKKTHIVTAHIEKFIKQSQEKVRSGSASSIKKACNTYKEILEALEVLGDDCTTRDVWLIHFMKQNMDDETQRLWASKLSCHKIPNLTEWFDFLKGRIDSMEMYKKEDSNTTQEKSKVKTHLTSTAKCLKCSQDHSLKECEEFNRLSVDARRKFVNDNSTCFNCLKGSHRAKDCRGKMKCQSCGKRHNTLLHLDNGASTGKIETQKEEQSMTSKKPSDSGTVKTHHAVGFKKSVLPTAQVYVEDVEGNLQKCRLLIDQGGECSFVSEALVQRLGLKRQNARVEVQATSEVSVGYTKGLVQIKMSSRYDDRKIISVDAYILSKLTTELPAREVDRREVEFFGNILLADPDFYKPGQIDMILGIEYAMSIITPGMFMTQPGKPVAQNTIFGYVIGGLFDEKESTNVSSYHVRCNLDAIVQRFWEVEDQVMDKRQHMTPEEELCEEQFQNTHTRDETGRYIVRLPFKDDKNKLGDSRSAAVARLTAMERKFTRNEEFHTQYKLFMKEFEDLGHMEKIIEDEKSNDKGKYYILPHHAVLRPSSTTTKLRVVFDASAPTTPDKISLNDVLAIGPHIQDDLLTILLRFRTYEVAFSADIEKMYRQILVHPEDRDYQMIVWRDDMTKDIEKFRLSTVTYGTACAPYLATRTLAQVANDYEEKYPKASEAIRRGFYMDDLLYGARLEEDAIKLKNQIQEVLQEGGFRLRKWTSNSIQVLGTIDEADRAISQEEVYDSKSIMALGLNWTPGSDEFSIVIQVPEKAMTKRQLLSETAKIFDPLGIITPVTIRFKIMYQKMWLISKDWDTALPEEVKNEYDKLRSEFGLLREVKVPRFIPCSDEEIELHCFSDASEEAYGVVIFARFKTPDGQVMINQVAAKSRVCPLKSTSIPRLELRAAALLTNLLKKIQDAVNPLKVKKVMWTDSTIVLQWLQSHPRRWKQFVANKTSDILEVTTPQDWRYVPTSDNPADCVSRGVSPKELIHHSLWWQGPAWLKQDEEHWPQNKVIIPQDTGEEKPPKKNVLMNCQSSPSFIDELIRRFSSYEKLIRTTAYILRFIKNSQSKSEEKKKGPIIIEEMTDARDLLIRHVQDQEYLEEIKRCKKGEQMPKDSKLKKLLPFIDDKGLLRVRGRLQNAQVSYNTQHPIILPPKHHFTKLLIESVHEKSLHASTTLLLSLLRQEYWIVNGRQAVKKVVFSCITCFMQKPKIEVPIMADLPAVRVQQAHPFFKTGCDFAGPFMMKSSQLRNAKRVKGYVCLFICMSTKAIHLEAVSELSTQAFLAALDRFVARRGKCSDLYCDNGKNFIGAEQELSKSEDTERVARHQDKVIKHMASSGIKFHFIPPYAPTFGGLWERGVRSTKYHLKRVLGESCLTYEEFSTLLARIESCLNSRPLCPMSDDPEDFDVLTPGHFLIGRSLLVNPKDDFSEVPMNRLTRWQVIQRMSRDFWKKWHMEYLTSLQQRPKWFGNSQNLCVGDLVIMKNENNSPNTWDRARVLELHPGKDGVTRVITVKTNQGHFKRPVSKIAKLPIN